MALKWEVDESSSTYIAKENGTGNAVVTIKGLASGLLKGETPSTNAPDGVSVNEKVVTIDDDALPTGSAGAVIMLEGNDYSIKLADDSNNKSVFSQYTAAKSNKSSEILLKAAYTAGWYNEDETDTNKRIGYSTAGSVRGANMTITGNGLRSDIAVSDISFTATDKDTPVTLKSSAFADASTLNDSSTVTISGNVGNCTLVLGEGVSEVGTADNTDLTWKVETVDSNNDGTPESATATLQKVLTAGWKFTPHQNNKIITFTREQTLNYANITGLAATATKEDLKAPEKSANGGEIALKASILPTTEGKPAVLNNTPYTPPGDTNSITPNFTLKLGEGATAPGNHTDQNSTISLKLDDVTEGATTRGAKVMQHLAAGWTINTDQNKITYKKEQDVTLASISGLSKDASATTATLGNEKIITLNAGALTKTDTSVVLTPTPLNTLQEKDSTYEDGDNAYKLTLGDDVDKTANQVVNGKYDLSVSSNKATVKQMNAQYWEVGDSDKKVTYHAEAAGKIVAELRGLGDGAKYSANGNDNTVAFDTGLKTITLKKAALKTGATVDTDKVEFNTTDSDAYALDSEYTIVLDSDADDVLAGARHSAPAIDATVGSNGTAEIKTTPEKGWQMDSDSKILSYVQPADVVLATITNLRANVPTSGNVTVDNENKTIKLLKADILQDVSDETSAESAHIVLSNQKVTGYTQYTYKLALDDSVAKYGAGDKTPKLTVTADTGASPATATAKITVTESAGWVIDDAAQQVSYKKAKNFDVATLAGLGTNATVNSSGVYSNVIFNAKAANDADKKIITLKKNALRQGEDATDYAITLTPAATEEASGGYDTDYTLAIAEDVTLPGGTYTNPGISIDYASTTAADNEPANTKTAKITGTLSEGWELDTAENSQTKNRKLTYTAAKSDTLAKITGLALNATAGTENDKNVILNATDKTVTLTEGAFRFADDNKTADGTAAANDTVVLTNAKGGASFKLALKKAAADPATVNEIGCDATKGWVIVGTTAKYQQGKKEGWRLDTTTDSPTKDLKVTYEATVSKADGNNLITVENLSSNITLGAKEGDTENTDSAVGTVSGQDFTPGLWISTPYVAPVAADAQNNTPAVTEVKGKLTLNRNVLDQGTAAKTITLKSDDSLKYEFSLANTPSDLTTYIPTTGRTKYLWTYNSSQGTATYKEATAKYWTLDDAKTTLTYKPQTDKATLAKVSGLSANLAAVVGDEFGDAAPGADGVIKGSYLKKSDGSDAVVSVTEDYRAAVAAVEDDPSTADKDETVVAQDEAIGVITLKADALNKKKVAFDSGSDKYGFALDGGVGKSEIEGEASWTTTATTATYKAKIKEGYSLAGVDSKGSAKSINYTAASESAELAKIEGLSGLTAGSGKPEGIDVTDNKITLKDSVLGTSKVTLKNGTNIEYKLKLDDGVLDGSTDAEKEKIKDGIDVWRINKTTATYQHVIPKYYTLAEDGSNVTCTPENSKATYATLNGIKSGLKVNANGKIVTNEGDADTAALVTIKAGATADKPSTIKLKAGALAENALSLTNGSGQNYILGLDEGVTKVAITGTTSWKVANGTATLTGNTRAGWNVETGDTPKAINYYPELTGKTLATITGLKTTITSLNNVQAPAADATDAEFALQATDLNGTDVTLTNDAFTDGTPLEYTIELAEQPTAAIDGDSRWYFDGTTKTTLHYGKVHDAHYEDSTTTNGVYDGETAIDKQTIKYIPEKKDTPDFSIKNLASDLTLNNATNGYVTGNNPVVYKDTTNVDNANGITLDISGKTVTMSKAVLSQGTDAPTEIVNKDGVTAANQYKLVSGNDVKLPQSNKEMLKLDGTKLTYYKGKSDGFTNDGNKITYVAAETATDKNTIATINGLSSNLVQKDGKIGTVDTTTKKFTEQVTREEGTTTFTIKKGALDETNHTTIKIDGGTLVFGTDITDADKPQAAKNWVVGKTSGSYTYNSGTTAGWTAPNEGEHAGEIYYQPAAYDTVLVTLSDLKSGLKVGTVDVTNGGDTTKIPALLDTKGKAVTVNDSSGLITLTSFALAKKDAKLLNAKKDDGTLVGTTGYKFATDQSKKADKPTENADTFVAESTAKGVWEKDKSKADKATYTVTITEGYKADNTAEKVEAGKTATYDARVVYTKADKAVATITGLSESTTVSNDTISGITVVNDQYKVQTGTIKVTPSALGKTDKATLSIKLSNSKSDYKLQFDGDLTTYEDGKAWNVAKNGTATYVQKYKANSYAQKSDTEITYTKDASEVTLATVTGLDKLTADDKGVTEADAKTKYGLEVVANQLRSVPTGKKDNSGDVINEEKTFNQINLTKKDALGTANVVVKDGTTTVPYEFNLGDSSSIAAFGVIDYKDNPQWSHDGKGTVTLDAGKSKGWAYKDDADHKTLTYTKAAPKIVATIKGLSSDIIVDNNIVYATKTDGQGDNAKLVADHEKQAIDLGTAVDSVTPIQLNEYAFLRGDNLKKNAKVTLALTNDGKYKLVAGTGVNTPIPAGKVWSINNGTASYQYDTDDGWTFDEAGKNVTYSEKETTVLAKITGLKKDLTTVVKDKDGKVTSNTAALNSTVDNTTLDKIIEVNDQLETDAGGKLVTFTLKNADYLAGAKVTLTPVDKKNATYQLFADESINSKTYDAKWDIDGKKGSATLGAGTEEGYDNPKTTDKAYGTTVNYVKAKVNTAIATITGLKQNKDADTTANTRLEDLISEDNSKGLVADTNAGTIALKDGRILGTKTVTLGGKGGYTFDAASLGTAQNNSNIDTNTTPKLTANNGTVTLVDVTEAGKFALSSDSKKLVINTKKDTETVLATVKGLNKTLKVHDGTGTSDSTLKGKIVTTTTEGKGKDAKVNYNGTEVVSYDNASGVITLNKDALANSNITFTLGKGVSKGDYTLQLASTVNTNTSDYKNKSAWTIKNGTASYKVKYNEGFYTKTDKGYTYTKETNGTVYATISGLKKTLTDTDIAAFNNATTTNGTSAAITLNKDLLDEKNVTLSNKKFSGSTVTNFTLALDTTSDKKVTELSTLGNFEWKGGKLTATQSEGYLKASDTQITFLKKDKENQAVATITGLSKDATIAKKPTKADDNLEIVLNKADLSGKNVTITTTNLTTGNYTLKLGNDAPKTTITAIPLDKADDPWSVKSGTATYSGYMTEGYRETAGGKTIVYTKAAGSALVPATDTKKEKPAVYKALTTIKGVTESTAPTSSNTNLTNGTVTLSSGTVTLGSGLFGVDYSGTNITGSKDADTIKLTNSGSVTVNGGKGDDSIDLGSATATIVYANGDGYDVITGFSSDDTISIPKSVVSASDVKVKKVKENDSKSSTIITVGKGAIQLTDYTGAVTLIDKNGEHSYGSSASDLLADDNYSMDAASLSDIVEPFKASYTPYDFETGLDLVKKDSFAPALTFTGTSDKK